MNKETMTVRLDNILTKKQINEIIDYINQENKKGLRATETQVIIGLKQILHKYRNELVKGFDSDFLAYVIAFEAAKSRCRDESIRNYGTIE